MMKFDTILVYGRRRWHGSWTELTICMANSLLTAYFYAVSILAVKTEAADAILWL